MKCERCGKVAGRDENDEAYDYCAVCSKNLCPDCMAQGCCGNIPAHSGMQDDYGDEGVH